MAYQPSTDLNVEGWHYFHSPIQAPAFRLLSVNVNKQRNLGNIRAEKLLLTFIPGVWAPWARKLLKQLDEQQAQLAEQGVRVVAIIAQKEEQLEEYVRRAKIKITVLADPHGAITTRYGIFDDMVTEPMQLSKPTLFVLDKEKRIHFKYIGKHLTHRPRWAEINWVLQHDINPKPKWWESIPFIGRLFYANN